MTTATERPSRARLAAILQATVLDNPFIPHAPTLKQATFLVAPEREVLYGGAAGGGKSDALLMAALQYVEDPSYSALILRRTYSDLNMDGAIMDRAHEWLDGTGAEWSEKNKRWTFPSGARLTFGYCENKTDMARYKSAEFQFIGIDEVTDLDGWITFLISRLRRKEGSVVPIRWRMATNPGGRGHEWVKARYIEDLDGNPIRHPERRFIPAGLDDNPHLDADEYAAALDELDPVSREQLKKGDWNVKPKGNMFRREWFPIVEREDVPSRARYVRRWDMASTEEAPGKDPDWTVGTLLAYHDGVTWIVDVVRFREASKKTDERMAETAAVDGRRVRIRWEEEGGSAGKKVTDHLRRRVFPGYDAKGERSTGSKTDRARPFSAACAPSEGEEHGNVRLVRGAWIPAWLDEVEAFPDPTVHDDQVDSASSGYSDVATPGMKVSGGKVTRG